MLEKHINMNPQHTHKDIRKPNKEKKWLNKAADVGYQRTGLV